MQDRVLVVASGLVRFANGLNWVVAFGFVIAIIASFAFGDALTARIATKYHGHYVGETIWLLRLTGVLGLAACAPGPAPASVPRRPGPPLRTVRATGSRRQSTKFSVFC